MIAKRYKIYLFISIICFLLTLIGVMVEEDLAFVNPMVLGIFFGLTIVSHFFSMHEYYKYATIFNVEKLFTRIIIVGMVALGLIISEPLFPYLGIQHLAEAQYGKAMDLVVIGAAFVYFLVSIMLYRKLIFHRRDNMVIRQWGLFMIILMIAAIAMIEHLHLPEIVWKVIFVAGFLVFFPLVFRIKWIADLKMRVKWLSVFFLLTINLISLAVIQKMMGMGTIAEGIISPFYCNPFLLLLSGSATAYGVLSMLALLFNLPISSVIEEQNTEIRSYQEMSQALQNKESEEKIFERLFNICFQNTQSNAGWLMLQNENIPQTVHTSNIYQEQIELINAKIGFYDLLQVSSNEKPYHYFPDLIKAKVFTDKQSLFQSLIIFPIFDKNEQLLATISLIKPFAEGFDEYMINMVRGYIDQSKLAFENIQLLQETIESARYKEELQIAQKVQADLMPQKFPESEYFEIGVFHESAKEVGGDYYDYNQRKKDQLAIVIGDVSGKGTSAAFHMAQMKGIFQSLIQVSITANHFLTMANRAISNCLEKKRFITLFYIMLNFDERKFQYSRAGHCPMLYFDINTQRVDYLEGDGMGLGIIRNDSYRNFIEVKERILNEGDVLVLYTDGLVEGRSSNENEQYGYHRLKKCLEVNSERSAEGIKNAIVEDFKGFTDSELHKDDTAILVLKIKSLD
ncbi:MAG: GAF domain-containing SpoIIE family protein phosphatase [Chitinophagales bacterium]